MSRIIVKGLPNDCNENKLRNFFKKYGTITDCSLKFTKEGKFRKFAFIGFSEESCGDNAIGQTNNTYMGSAKLMVEECKPFGDASKPRAWSRHAKDSSAYKRTRGEEDVDEGPKKTKKEPKVESVKKPNVKDEKFKDFLEAKGVVPKEEEESPEDTGDDSLKEELLLGIHGDTKGSVAVFGLPPNIKAKHVKDWFSPIRVKALKLVRNDQSAAAFVSFERAGDAKKALLKTKQFLGGYKIRVETVELEEETPMEYEQTQEPVDEEETRNAILDTGRLFLRNLPFSTVEDELRLLFKKYGEIAEVQVVVTRDNKCKGFAIVEFVFPENALAAFVALDGSIFKGRMLHIIPGQEKKAQPEDSTVNGEKSSFKKEKMAKLKSSAQRHSWNALFLGPNAVADSLAEKLGVEKSALLGETGESTAVRMALAETRLVRETRQFLLDNGVRLDAFSRPAAKRSDRVLLVKNLPAGVQMEELSSVFAKHGEVENVLLPPDGISALVVMANAFHAKNAFKALAYSRFRNLPLYLEYAPGDVFEENAEEDEEKEVEQKVEATKKSKKELTAEEKKKERKSKKHRIKEEELPVKEEPVVKEEIEEEEKVEEEPPKKKKREEDVKLEEEEAVEEREVEDGSTVFVNNLSFNTTDESLAHLFRSYTIHSATVSRRFNPANPSAALSMGFGFVQFYTKEDALDAIKVLQGSLLDGHAVQLKLSDRETKAEKKKKTVNRLEQGNTTKLIVRNLPFQAVESEVESLFTTFGTVKSVRLPRKVGSKSHRGFGFVDFASKGEAKRAFEALVHSTHLYGRRLVLEWANDEEDIDDLRKKTINNFSGNAKDRRKMKKQMEQIQNDLERIDDD